MHIEIYPDSDEHDLAITVKDMVELVLEDALCDPEKPTDVKVEIIH